MKKDKANKIINKLNDLGAFDDETFNKNIKDIDLILDELKRQTKIEKEKIKKLEKKIDIKKIIDNFNKYQFTDFILPNKIPCLDC